jgi:hypothetical protein
MSKNNLWCRLGRHRWLTYQKGCSIYEYCPKCPKERFVRSVEHRWEPWKPDIEDGNEYHWCPICEKVEPLPVCDICGGSGEVKVDPTGEGDVLFVTCPNCNGSRYA